MVNFKTEHKTCQQQRERVKQYESKIKESNPQRYIERLDYHKKYYRERKEALLKLKSLGIVV